MYPEIVGIEIAKALDVLKLIHLFRRALGNLAQEQTAIGRLGQMAPFAVASRAFCHFHQKGKLFCRHVAQNSRVNNRAQIVRVADKGIFIALVQERLQCAAGVQGQIDVAVARWTPLLVRVIGPNDRGQGVLADFGHFVLQKVQGQGLGKCGISGQCCQRFPAGAEAVHQQQGDADLVLGAQGQNLPGDNVEKGQAVFDG